MRTLRFAPPMLKAVWAAAFVILLAVLAAHATQAAPRYSVSLTYFRGEAREDGAHLEWQTATELDTAGFRIKRANEAGGPYAELSEIGLVPAQGSATSGANYDALDATMGSSGTYWYQLVEIELNGQEHVLETISLLAGATPTATIAGIATDDLPGATATSQTSATGTAGPTLTPTRLPATPTMTPRPADGTNEAPLAPTEAVPPEEDVTPRAIGDGVAEAAAPAILAQPTAIAQATGAYPGPEATTGVPEEGYPGATDAVLTPTLAVSVTTESYPAGPSTIATQPALGGPTGNAIGTNNELQEETPDAAEESSPLGRILLWVGFAAALLIFIAGAAFSIILSTRKQQGQSRKDL